MTDKLEFIPFNRDACDYVTQNLPPNCDPWDLADEFVSRHTEYRQSELPITNSFQDAIRLIAKDSEIVFKKGRTSHFNSYIEIWASHQSISKLVKELQFLSNPH